MLSVAGAQLACAAIMSLGNQDKGSVMAKAFKGFDDAWSNLPVELVGSSDPLKHKSVEDLAKLAVHEMELYDENEETGIVDLPGYRRVQKFLARCVETLG